MAYMEISDYQDHPRYSAELNRLTETIWGITVLDGYPSDYVPFSMQSDGKTVANVSVGRFDVVINGVPMPASMIQTVLTDPAYRRQGLIRRLFGSANAHIHQTTGRTFFTASKENIQFYEQFGYRHAPMIDHFRWSSQGVDAGVQASELRPVTWTDDMERQRFEALARRRAAVSSVFGFEQSPWLLLWFCRHFLSSHLFFWPAKNIYLIFRVEPGRLDLLDIIGDHIPDWSELSPVLPVETGTDIRCFFVPDKLNLPEPSPVFSDEDRFFFDAAFPLPEWVCLPETQRG